MLRQLSFPMETSSWMLVACIDFKNRLQQVPWCQLADHLNLVQAKYLTSECWLRPCRRYS